MFQIFVYYKAEDQGFLSVFKVHKKPQVAC